MRDKAIVSGSRAVALIAIVYVYFLIFAQFAFLTRLAELGIAENAVKIVMAAMALGGILFSLLTPRTQLIQTPARTLRIGLAVSAIAAVITLLPLDVLTAGITGFLIGAGLGITTVTLVTHLRRWTGERHGIIQVGIGTGLAYFICNLPVVFTATPRHQAIMAACLCVIAILLPLRPEDLGTASGQSATIPFPIALISFAALIWLDSAAFYIIQHTPVLKAGTWLGAVHLWTNGTLHLLTAFAAALLLARGRAATTLALAFSALAFACVLLQHASLILSASLFYPVGVSLYSVALVTYPSFLTKAESTAHRAKQAGWIYGIGGWMGSALGIGMGQNLGRVPLAFVSIAGVAVLAPLGIVAVKNRKREFLLTGAVAALAFLLYALTPQPKASAALSAMERGRRVYISEGCISCHSQYVRPESQDVLMWGPTDSLEDLHRQKPPLIGNRRQGPDLAQVGVRRSPLWLKAHLINPAEISYRSPMPSYAFLFADARGNDLVTYLSSLHGPGAQQHSQMETAWTPTPAAFARANAQEGEMIYEQECATCHDASGATRLHWVREWRKAPQTLSELRSLTAQLPLSKLAQIAKFGIPGTDMPGHEYLSDQQIASIALFLKLADSQAVSQTPTH